MSPSKALHDPGPDIVVVDEAHVSSSVLFRALSEFVIPNFSHAASLIVLFEQTMLTKTTNKIFNALSAVKTKRRIALTGSPLQNNLFEYFRMVSWVRPGVLGFSEANFDREYASSIMTGLASDASAFAIRTSNEASKRLHTVLSPYVQRKDANVLRKDLPKMQQVILHVRQTKLQVHLYRAFKRYRKSIGLTNFFQSYQMIRPLHNHPGTLLMTGESDESEQKGSKQRDIFESPVEASKSAPEEVRDNCESPVEVSKPAPEEVARDAQAETNDTVSNAKASGGLEIVELSSDSEMENGVDNPKPAEADDPASSEGIRSANASPVPCDVEKSVVSVEDKDSPGVTDGATDGGGSVTEAECKVSVESTAAPASGLPPSGRTKAAGHKEEWWRNTVERHGGVEKLKEVEQGYKVVLLLHILMEAQALNDKVLVFAQCLKTLDFLEYVLGLDDWVEHVPSLASSFTGGKRGAWKKNVDYLRIDGQTQFSERGELIARFNDERSSSKQSGAADEGDQVKAFLLSAKVSRTLVLSTPT